MQLKHSFTVPAPVDEAWSALIDIERIAPCMPGAALDSVEGDSFTGRVKVKLGPVNLTYRGQASFVEKDPGARRAVIDARGKDQRGNGTASARISASLAEAGEVGTRVDVLTDLDITGRPAQFGRSVMADVGDRLLAQFSSRLAEELASGPTPAPAAEVDGGPAGPAAELGGAVPAAADRASGDVRREPSGEPQAIDLFQLAGGSAVVRRFTALAGLATAAVVVLLFWRRRRS
jgi:carbon monoxide dehydrogenase subunit G